MHIPNLLQCLSSCLSRPVNFLSIVFQTLPMSVQSPKPKPTRPLVPAHRLAVLVAAEARLRGDQPSPDTLSPDASTLDPSTSTAPSPSLTTNGQVGREGLTKQESWNGLDEKEDRELRIKFGRLLDRGIVRDNGYKQSAEAVEVSPIHPTRLYADATPVSSLWPRHVSRPNGIWIMLVLDHYHSTFGNTSIDTLEDRVEHPQQSF